MDKPRLKVETVKAFRVDADDLNRFVEAIYGGSYEFMANEEADFNVDYETEAPNMAMDFGEAKKIRSGKYPMYSLDHIFNVLHEDGHIPAGKYLIRVDH